MLFEIKSSTDEKSGKLRSVSIWAKRSRSQPTSFNRHQALNQGRVIGYHYETTHPRKQVNHDQLSHGHPMLSLNQIEGRPESHSNHRLDHHLSVHPSQHSERSQCRQRRKLMRRSSLTCWKQESIWRFEWKLQRMSFHNAQWFGSFIYHFLFLEPFKTFLMLKTHHFVTCVGPTRIRLGVLLLGIANALKCQGKAKGKAKAKVKSAVVSDQKR